MQNQMPKREKLIATLKAGKIALWNRWAILRGVNLSGANLSGANLSGAYLSGAYLIHVNLSGVNLSGVNLSGVNLSGANLSGAYLSGANLSGAYLSGAYLSHANLSGSKGLLCASSWLKDNFAYKNGYIVYRAEQGIKPKPEHWTFEPGKALTEVANPDRCTECGSGVHFATLSWVKINHPGQIIWRCKIEPRDLPSVVVPYNSDGKARCERLVLLEKVED
jgi:hypothetical protein